ILGVALGIDVERVGTVTRQYRDVVALGNIQMDLAGIDGHLWCSSGPAHTIANIAHRRHAYYPLARFAGAPPATARRPDGRGAGVQTRANGCEDRRACARGSGRVGIVA